MAAEAVINLQAKDNTRSAFASVQASLRNLKSASAEAGQGLRKNLDLKDAGRTLAMSLGASYDKIADKVARFFTDSDEDTQKLRDSLTGLSEEELKAQARLIAARNTDEQQLTMLERKQAALAAAVAKPAQSLEEQNTRKQQAIDLINTEIELIGLRKKIEDESTQAEEDRRKVLEELGKAQKAYLGERTTYEERITGKLARQAVVLQRMASLGEGKDAEKERNKLTAEYATLLTDVNALQYEQRANARAAADAIATGFEDAIMTGRKFSDTLKAIGQDILRLFIRQQFTAPLAAALGSMFGGSSIFASLFMPRALGGPVNAGQPYLVGERGAELFVPSSSGTIRPSHQTDTGGSGGGGINITYNIASGVSRAELAPLLEQERKRLKAEIPDMVRRGGAYRAAFA